MTAAAPTAATSTALTPTMGRQVKRAVFWVAAAVFILIVATLSFAAAGSGADSSPLGASSPTPGGAQALVEVLRSQGVDVTATSSLVETEDAVGDADATTLVIYDPDNYLTDAQLGNAVELAGRVVVIAPGFAALQAVAPEVAQAGTVTGAVDGDCDLRAATNAETVTGDGDGYRVIDDDADAVACFGSGDDVYSLIQLDRGASTLTVLGTTDALSNEHIADRGNAALALTLLGEVPSLIWYVPTFADVEALTDETIAELTPGWVIPIMILLVLTVIAAAVWRGRRFGPLVVENLSVTVRSSETMEGRARLYATASARLRALDALRIGTIARLATACGLPRTASVDEVADAAAAVIGLNPADLRNLLVDADPRTDAQLVALSDELLRVERAVQAAARPPAAPRPSL